MAFADSLFIGIEDDIRDAVLACGAGLAELGANVTHIEFPEALQAADINPGGMISIVEGHAQNRALLETDSPSIDPIVAKRLRSGAPIPAFKYHIALREMAALRRRAETAMAPYDALLAPTVPMTAQRLAVLEKSSRRLLASNAHYALNTRPVNILGLCAVSVPRGLSGEGLPMGLQIIGKAGDAGRILQIAQLMIDATGDCIARTHPEAR